MIKTRIALLGTLANLHRQPIQYDLAEVAHIASDLLPDLLGVEVERAEFERDDLSRAPVEVREALVPLAQRSDIVLVPIGAPSPEELRAPPASIRAPLNRVLDATVAWLQKTANDARRVNSAFVSHTCGLICHLEEYTSGARGRQAWTTTNERMLGNIKAMVERDPGRRILVAVQCRRKHWLEPKLRQLPDVELVNYWEL
jgi:hypothetical protein